MKNTFPKKWLIVLSAIFVFSCESDSDIGLDLLPQDDLLNATLVDSFDLEVSTVLLTDFLKQQVEVVSYPEGVENTLLSSNVVQAGAYVDPIFGRVEAKAFFQPRLVTASPDLGTNPVCDTIRLRFLVDQGSGYLRVYGDTTKAMALEVERMTEDFGDSTIYTVDDVLATDGTNYVVSSPSEFMPSTEEYVLELDNALGNEILAAANGNTQETFLTTFKGLMLRAADGADGHVFGFNSQLSTSYRITLELDYRNDEGDTTTFELQTSTAGARQTNIITDRSSSAALSSLNGSGDVLASTGLAYMQAGSGIGTKVSVTNLQSILDSLEGVVINRAELVAYVDPSTTDTMVNDFPVRSLIMYRIGGDNQIIKEGTALSYIRNDNVYLGGSELFGFDSDTLAYKFPLTRYFQQLVTGQGSVEGSWFIAPNANTTTVNRSVLFDADTNQHGNMAMRLKVYYTKQGQ